MYEYTFPLCNFCHEANHIFHRNFCLCCGSLSFKIIFSAALELVVIHHAMDPNNRFNGRNLSLIDFVIWKQISFMPVLLLTR